MSCSSLATSAWKTWDWACGSAVSIDDLAERRIAADIGAARSAVKPRTQGGRTRRSGRELKARNNSTDRGEMGWPGRSKTPGAGGLRFPNVSNQPGLEATIGSSHPIGAQA